jgi:NADH dehydrogenase
MAKKNIVIIGAGFAGLSALGVIAKKALRDDFRIILIDKKTNFEFLPMLPDIVGGWLNFNNLCLDLRKISRRYHCEFINDEVVKVDIAQKKINLTNNSLDYEYLVISSGSQTNFFNNQNALNNCLKLDDINDALQIKKRILERAQTKEAINIVVVGGGYTGIEIATNIRYLLIKNRIKKCSIYILEKSAVILKMLPEWIRNEVERELKRLDIKVSCNQSLKSYDKETILLESGREIRQAVCIWSAGVKISSFIERSDLAKEHSRVKVNEMLQIPGAEDNNIFLAGDVSFFLDKKSNHTLRMAVMFAIGQGKICGKNLVNSICKKPLVKYQPVDLSYLIPLGSRGVYVV